MSDEQINRMIAKSLEPLPYLSGDEVNSIGGCWVWMKCLNKRGRPDYEYQPRNFLTDPAMTLMLMRHHGFIEVALVDGEYVAEFCGNETHSPTGCEAGTFGQALDKDLGRAVALAYMKAHGLEGK